MIIQEEMTMKKTIVLILTFALLLALSACKIPTGENIGGETDKAQNPSNDSSQIIQDVPSSPTDTTENESANNQKDKAPAQSQNEQTKKPSVSQNSSSQSSQNKKDDNLISRSKAIDIALKSAKLSQNSVYDLDAELDREPYGTYWEVDFETREKEYSYEIDAVSGKIVHSNIERND